jgi:phosphoribosylanthranilate isomerase
MTRVKICCITSVEEGRLAVGQGASAVGLVSAMPSGPGVITEERIAEIAATVPPPVATVLLTSRVEADEIIAQQRRCRTRAVQLCDRVGPRVLTRLRQELPRVSLIQVIHVTGPEAVDEALATAPLVDALLLDSGKPSAAVKQLGGTGQVHDWSLSARIVNECGVPVLLAGGLNPDNVAEAISTVHPFAVDVCSGVRTDDRLDPDKLERFMNAAAVGNRTVIFGNSGSGKSTLARELVARHGCAHLDLDTVAWTEGAETPTRRPLDQSRELMAPFLAEHESWVIEGCYADLLKMVLPRATEILFLNPGTAVCRENCRRRPWEPHKYPSPEAQNANLAMLLQWVAQYEQRDDEFSLRAHRRLFDDYPGPKREYTSNARPEQEPPCPW